MALSFLAEEREVEGGSRCPRCSQLSVLESLNTAKNALLVPRQSDSHLRQVPVGRDGAL